MMPMGYVNVIDETAHDRAGIRKRIRPPLRAEAGAVPPGIGQNPHPVRLDEDARVADECYAHLSKDLCAAESAYSVTGQPNTTVFKRTVSREQTLFTLDMLCYRSWCSGSDQP